MKIISDYVIQFTLDYANWDKNQCRIIEVFRIPQVSVYTGYTIRISTFLGKFYMIVWT